SAVLTDIPVRLRRPLSPRNGHLKISSGVRKSDAVSAMQRAVQFEATHNGPLRGPTITLTNGSQFHNPGSYAAAASQRSHAHAAAAAPSAQYVQQAHQQAYGRPSGFPSSHSN